MSKYLFLLSCAAIPYSAAAQVRPSDPEAVERELYATEAQKVNAESFSTYAVEESPITVTATGFSTDPQNTGQSVTVIGQAEIEQIQGADIARVITRIPSVTLTRNGPLGSFTGVSVRGAASEQLLVLIDGVRVADQAAPGGGFDFGTLMATNVATLDLTRGANSTIWGADALGGVLDVSTRGREGLAAAIEYGARDTLTASASGGIEGEGYFFGLGGSALRTDGFSAAASGTEPDGHRQFGLSGSGFVDVTDALEAFVTARYAEGHLEIDGFPAPDYTLADTLETQFTRQYSGAAGLNYYGQELTLRASYGVSDTERTNADPASGPTFSSDGHTDSVTLRGEYRAIGGLTLAFGGEHQWSSYETDFDNRESARITGGYLQAGWVMGGLAAHLGARVDDHERFGSEVSFGGDVSYGLGNGWRLRGSVGEGFKAPTLFQLFSDFGNEALQPERSTSYDLGVEKGRRGTGTHFALTAFRRDSADLIGFDNTTFAYANTARARAQGIEVEAGVEVTRGLRIAGQYSLVATEDRANGRDLARRPRHSATLWADWTGPAGIALGADLRLVSKSFDDAANTVRLGGYEVLDLRASVPVIEGIELFGRVENVFDRRYQTAAGYNSTPRGAFVGVRGRM